MPREHEGEPLRLYWGTSGQERRTRVYGFSWTTDSTIAAGFAEHWQRSTHGAVLLETTAPAAAVLWKQVPEDYYDEGEVVVDPFALGRVTVAEKWPSRQDA